MQLSNCLAINRACSVSCTIVGSQAPQWKAPAGKPPPMPSLTPSQGSGPARLPGGSPVPGSFVPGSGLVQFTPNPPAVGQFRPPPSTWVPNAPPEEWDQSELEAAAVALQTGYPTWQENAAALQLLQSKGRLSPEVIYDLTFLSPGRQGALTIALQVYRSLVDEGASEEVLSRLGEGAVESLYELRTLSAAQRTGAVEYLLETEMNEVTARELAKAIKDHERRPQGREGFTAAAGDCLAFAHVRASTEATDLEVRQKCLQKAAACAATDSARARVQEMQAALGASK